MTEFANKVAIIKAVVAKELLKKDFTGREGDTYPNIQDNVGTATFVMYNMTAADIVTDAP